MVTPAALAGILKLAAATSSLTNQALAVQQDCKETSWRNNYYYDNKYL